MTDQPTTEVISRFVPDQRPVRRFVAAIALATLVLAALWWSGAFAPRLNIACHDRTGIPSDVRVVRFELENESPLPMHIVGMRGGAGTLDVSGVRVDGRSPPAGGIRMGGGETAALEVDLAGHDPLEPGTGAATLPPPRWAQPLADGMELVVRPLAGTERTFWLGTLLSDRSGCPPLDEP